MVLTVLIGATTTGPMVLVTIASEQALLEEEVVVRNGGSGIW